MSNRLIRVNELLQREISSYLRKRYASESVAITITGVQITGDLREATAIVNRYDIPFMNFCAAHGLHFDAVVHGAMELAGLAPRWRRAPYSSLDDAQLELLKTFFAARGLN